MAGKGGGGKDKGEGKPWQCQAPEEGNGKEQGKGKDSHGKDKGKGKPWQWQRQRSRGHAGDVTFFDHARGYGIIKRADGCEWYEGNKLFVLRDDVMGGALLVGDAVLYDEVMDEESGELKAENVTGGTGVNFKSVLQVVSWLRTHGPDIWFDGDGHVI
jgi:cold shock CspA family protein